VSTGLLPGRFSGFWGRIAARMLVFAHRAAIGSAHVPEMKQEQAVTPQREIAPQQEQSFDIGLGL